MNRKSTIFFSSIFEAMAGGGRSVKKILSTNEILFTLALTQTFFLHSSQYIRMRSRKTKIAYIVCKRSNDANFKSQIPSGFR